MAAVSLTEESAMPERPRRLMVLYLTAVSLLLLTVLACVGYVLRDQMLVDYQVHRYLQADTDDPDRPAELASWLGNRLSLSVPVIADRLRGEDPRACRRAGMLLRRMLQRRPDPTEPEHAHRSLALIDQVRRDYASYSTPGKLEAVSITCAVLEMHLARWSPSLPTALDTAGDLFVQALNGVSGGEAAVKLAALERLPPVWDWRASDNVAPWLADKWRYQCYVSAVQQMRTSESADVRAAAAAAVVGAPDSFRTDARVSVDSPNHFEVLLDLLDDPAEKVRRAAAVALSTTRADILSAERKIRLMGRLRHADPETGRALQKLLLGAGVSADYVAFAAELGSRDVRVRLTLLDRLAEARPDADPTQWVYWLAADPDAAVRRTAVRRARSLPKEDVRPLLEYVAEKDADAELRTLAARLLKDTQPDEVVAETADAIR